MSNEHKYMAMGEDSGKGGGLDRGPHKHRGIHEMAHVEHQDAAGDVHHRVGGDGERSGPPPIPVGDGKLHATAHSDHGPHNIGSKSRPIPC